MVDNQGVVLEKAGKLAEAIEKYRSAVALDPFQTVFRRNLGLALCRLNRWDEGIVELKQVLERDPEDIEATKALYIALDGARGLKPNLQELGTVKPQPR